MESDVEKQVRDLEVEVFALQMALRVTAAVMERAIPDASHLISAHLMDTASIPRETLGPELGEAAGAATERLAEALVRLPKRPTAP